MEVNDQLYSSTPEEEEEEECEFLLCAENVVFTCKLNQLLFSCMGVHAL